MYQQQQHLGGRPPQQGANYAGGPPPQQYQAHHQQQQQQQQQHMPLPPGQSQQPAPHQPRFQQPPSSFMGSAIASSSSASNPLGDAANLVGATAASNAISEDEKKFASEADVVLLNVGGVKFSTTVATLRRHPGTLAAALFSEDNLKKFKPDKSGYYFVDRNGDAFETVLEFLRTGKLLHQSKKVGEEVVREELRHWRVAPEMVDPVDRSPALTLADRYRARTLQSMMHEGRIYIDHFMRYMMQEMDMAASLGKSEIYMLLGNPDASSSSSSKTSSLSSRRTASTATVGKGKAIHDGNLHKWLTLRRGHLTLARQAIEREGLKCDIRTGLPQADWIQIIVRWPLDANELKGAYLWE
jgi:BTB/POZ domain